MCRPSPTHHAASDMRDQTDSDAEQDQGGSSWRAHGSAESLHSLERRRSTDEGSHRPYGIPLLTRAFEWPSPERDEPPPRFQPRFSPSVEPPRTPTIDPPGGPILAVSHHGKQTEGLTRRSNLTLRQSTLIPDFFGHCTILIYSTADTALRHCMVRRTGIGGYRLDGCHCRGHNPKDLRRGLCCRR